MRILVSMFSSDVCWPDQCANLDDSSSRGPDVRQAEFCMVDDVPADESRSRDSCRCFGPVHFLLLHTTLSCARAQSSC